MKAWRSALLVVAVSGCAASPHQAQNVWNRAALLPTMRVLGCVDLGFTVARDPRIPPDSLLLYVSLRNRCVRPAPFDASALRILGTDSTGRSAPLVFYDPRNEIKPEEIDSEAEGTERIRLDAGPRDAAPADLVRICVDASNVSKEARLAGASPVCMSTPGHTGDLADVSALHGIVGDLPRPDETERLAPPLEAPP